MTGKERLINVICSIIGVLIAILFLVLLCFIIDKLISKKANDKEIVEIYSVDLKKPTAREILFLGVEIIMRNSIILFIRQQMTAVKNCKNTIMMM